MARFRLQSSQIANRDLTVTPNGTDNWEELLPLETTKRNAEELFVGGICQKALVHIQNAIELVGNVIAVFDDDRGTRVGPPGAVLRIVKALISH
jgi:hypothetical protein